MGDGCKDIEMKQFSTPSGMNSRRSRLAVALQYFHFFRACNGWGGGAGGTQIAFLCHGGALKSSNFGCYGKTHGFGVAIFEVTSIWGRMHHLGGGTFGARNPTTFLNGPRYQCCLIFVAQPRKHWRKNTHRRKMGTVHCHVAVRARSQPSFPPHFP